MLVLSRNINESIIINENITLKIIGVRGGQVRMGIDAPKNVSIHREEIFNKIKAEQLDVKKADDATDIA